MKKLQMTAAIYIRVSTDDQLEFSPDAQKRALIEYAKKNRYQIDEQYIFIDEGISGTSAKKRPAFMRMIATSKKKPKPFDAILVHKFDRFARSREDSVVYKSLLRKECGIKVISITEQMEDDKFSVILEAMLEAMAEYYSLNLSDEVMKGMTEKARRGGVQSMPILGYDIVDNKRIVNDEESKLVEKIFNMCISGESIGSIAKYLNRLGYRNKRGKPFDGRRVKYMLENPVYYGAQRWNYTTTQGTKKVINDEKDWIMVENMHDPIITKEIWDNAQVALGKWHRTTKPASKEYIHWLGGLLRCSKCGGTLVYKTARFKRQDGSIRVADGFQCCRYKAGSCDTSNYISVKDAEIHVKNILKKVVDVINDTGTLDGLNVEINKSDSDNELLRSQIDKLNNKMSLAKKAYLNEIDTLEEYKENKNAIQKEIDEIKNLITSEEITTQQVQDFKGYATTALKLIEDESVSVANKNKSLKCFVSQIVYDKEKIKLYADFFMQ